MLEESRRQSKTGSKNVIVESEALYFRGDYRGGQQSRYLQQNRLGGRNFQNGQPSRFQGQFSASQGNSNPSGGFQNRQIQCFYCGRFGHPKDMCPERLVDIRKLEADRRAKLGIGQISANVVQEES